MAPYDKEQKKGPGDVNNDISWAIGKFFLKIFCSFSILMVLLVLASQYTTAATSQHKNIQVNEPNTPSATLPSCLSTAQYHNMYQYVFLLLFCFADDYLN